MYDSLQLNLSIRLLTRESSEESKLWLKVFRREQLAVLFTWFWLILSAEVLIPKAIFMFIYLFFLFSKLLAFSCEHLRTESGCIKTIYFSEITTVGDVFTQFCKCKKRIRLLWKYFTSFVTTANCFVYIDVLKFLSILIYFFYSFNYYNAVTSNWNKQTAQTVTLSFRYFFLKILTKKQNTSIKICIFQLKKNHCLY